MDDVKEKMGQAIDRLENLQFALGMQIPNEIHVDQMRIAIPEIVQDMKDSFINLTGENPWE